MLKQIKNKLLVSVKPYFAYKDITRTYKLLKPFIFRQWKAYTILFLLLAINIAFTLSFAWFFGNLTDAAIHSDFKQLKTLIPVGILLTLVSIAANYCGIYFETVAANGVKNHLKEHLFSHILRLPASETSNMRSGDLLSYFNNDIHAIDGVVGGSLINLLKLPLTYLAVLIYLLQIDWILCLISVLIAPIAITAGGVFGILLKRNGRKIHDLVANINSLLSETFQGMQVIRSFTLEKMTFENFFKKNKEYYKLELENSRLQGWYYSGGYLINSIAFLTSLCLGSYFVSKNTMSVGELLIFTNLIGHLVYPLTGIAGQWAGFQRSAAAIDRLAKLLEVEVPNELPSFIKAESNVNSIEFKNLSFSYDESKQIFKNFCLAIPEGKTVAFVGPSGAGKTTLFNLLQGFYQPQQGEVLIDGVSTIDMSISRLRSMVSNVPQETYLFGGSIKENLLIARPGISESELVLACRKAQIHDFIVSLPNGYETEVGEQGIKLSGGQKQRIAIARAILKDAPILLLDEVTSSLDGETESNMKDAMGNLMKSRTTLVIAHRLSTIQDADVIVVLNEGKIVQIGTHLELINQNGFYLKLCNSAAIKKEAKHSRLSLAAR